VPDDQTPDVVARLWDDHKQRRATDARERLILHYASS
jgi:hypothetical protein